MKKGFLIIAGIVLAGFVIVIYSTFFVNRANEIQDTDQYTAPVVACGIDKQCPVGRGQCYQFEDEETPICFQDDPCQKCASKQCQVMESFPMQVRCL